MDAWTLDAEGGKEKVVPKNGKHFTLEEVRELIDCRWVEVHSADDPDMILLFDEEGKLNDKDFNLQATVWVKTKLFRGDVIVGKALYCPREMFK